MNLATLSPISVELSLTTLPNQDKLPCDDGESMEN
jgi:hypothetical protein